MIATHETLWLEASPTSAGALGPGTVQRALRSALRLSSDAIGLLNPVGRGRVAVEIALPQALDIRTPLTLSVRDGERPVLFTLRRESDPELETHSPLRVTWTGGTRPSPGQLARALTRATEDRFHASDLGVTFEGANQLLVSVSEGLTGCLALPTTTKIDGVTLTLDHGGVGQA